MVKDIALIINGERYEVSVAPYETLADVLRDKLGLLEVKKGCDSGGCGACTVLVDSLPVYSCLMLAVQVEGKAITTVRGLSKYGEELHPLQKNFIKYGAIQCGFCTPGIIVAAKALLDKNPRPNEEEVREAISGNACRCTGYLQIVEAILATATESR
jgi:carbon-monoxide dehydrogenase small subunit